LTILFHFTFPFQKRKKKKNASESFLPSHPPYPSFKKEKEKEARRVKASFLEEREGAERVRRRRGNKSGNKKEILTSSNLESTVLATKLPCQRIHQMDNFYSKNIHK
jgi:hypothetical protein